MEPNPRHLNLPLHFCLFFFFLVHFNIVADKEEKKKKKKREENAKYHVELIKEYFKIVLKPWCSEMVCKPHGLDIPLCLIPCKSQPGTSPGAGMGQLKPRRELTPDQHRAQVPASFSNVTLLQGREVPQLHLWQPGASPRGTEDTEPGKLQLCPAGHLRAQCFHPSAPTAQEGELSLQLGLFSSCCHKGTKGQ